MLITLTCYAPNAPEIGHLLAKHPNSVFERDFSAGRVWVFYPEVAEAIRLVGEHFGTAAGTLTAYDPEYDPEGRALEAGMLFAETLAEG